jgi:imidazolonepropionase-like amidohydrolase
MQALLDPPQVELREGYDVLVDDVMIKEVSDRPLETSADRAIDLRGRTLMPGLIDLHAHAVAVELNLARQVRMPNVLVRLRSTLINLRGMLRRGFTTVQRRCVRTAETFYFDTGQCATGHLFASPVNLPTPRRPGPSVWKSGLGSLHEGRQELCSCPNLVA